MMWFEELPERWDVEKISGVFTERQTKVSDTDFAPLSVSKGGIVPQIATVAKSNAGDNRKLVRKGDFVINSRSDRRGSSGVSSYDGSVSLINIVLEPRKEENGGYYHYLLRSHNFIEEYYRNGRGIVADLWTTRYAEMKTIYLPLPPRDEQDQIVRYLDWKVSQINKLINAKRQQIALFQEQKRAVIDSEISGEPIPLKRLLLTPLQYGANDSGTVFDENLPRYIRITDITVDGHLKEDEKKSLSNSVAAPYLLQNGDILLARSGATAGKAFLYKYEYGVCAFAGYLIKASIDNQRVLPEYLLYVTFGSEYDTWKKSIFIQATIQNISAERYNYFQIPLPSIILQKDIVTRLNEKCTKIDKLIDTIKKEIAMFTEYRTRLISDVVTGKLDVRGVAVPEYEAIDESADEEPSDDDTMLETEE